jgi:predicted RNase H-like nuclease
VVEFVLAHVGKEPAIIAIDAPLVVPNEAGRRPAEAEIGSVFARYRASAHSASRKRLAPNGTVRGEELVDRLEDNRFVHRAEVEALTPVRQAIEVHPHPAIISIFDLDQIIKHKARKKQPHDSRLTELRRYQACLPFLERKEPALLDARELLNLDPATLIKVKPD